MTNIILIGASGHAAVAIDAIERRQKYRIAGLVDARQPLGHEVLSYPVLGREEDLPRLVHQHDIGAAIVTIGDNWTRREVVCRIRRLIPELPFASAIHPHAAVASSASIGDGAVIFAGAVINPRARVGHFCIVNTNASLDHDSVLDDFSCLLPGAVTGGNVSIGSCSAVCLGANVIHNVQIGEHSVIGAGSTVLADIPSHVVAYGCPARVIRPRVPGEPYL